MDAMGWWRATKRWLVLTHLYLGVVLSLLFVMWFATGIVLMYAPFPGFGGGRDYTRMPVLDCAACRSSLQDALRAMPDRDTDHAVRVGMLADTPVYRYVAHDRRVHIIRADDLHPLPPLDRAGALRYAPHERADAVLLPEADQWTVERVFRDQLPLWRVTLHDGLGTQRYVSAYGHEVILQTTRRERALAWVGAIPHWLYPRLLRAHVRWWVWTILVVGTLGTVMSVAGVAVGVWQARWRRRRASRGRVLAFTPYRTAWMRWHHWSGLVFGVITCTWIFSGTMSVTPFDWSPGDQPTAKERRLFAAGDVAAVPFDRSPRETWQVVVESLGLLSVRELEAQVVRGRGCWIARDADGVAHVVDTAPLSDDAVRDGVRAMRPGVPVAAVDRLPAYDAYYYRTLEGRPRPLPVVRVQLADADRSAYYVDPVAGTVVMRQVRRSRWERWLYRGLHDFDLPALTTRRPLWDVLVVLLSLGGLVVSLSGVVVAWRWLAPRIGMRAGARR